MKKVLMALVALMLIMAMTASALAVTMYVNRDPGKVFNKNSKKSKIISNLPFGGAIDVFETKGDWSHINYINKNGKQKSGWMISKHLSATKPCKHNWGKWKVTKKATCTKEGVKEHTCSICGVTETKKIEKTEHDWDKWQVTKKPTCTKTGERVHKCKICGTKKTEKLNKSAHSYGDWTVTKEATCSEKGERTRTCSICNYVQTEYTDTLPHEFGEWETVVPLGRDTDGERRSTCVNCGAEELQIVEAMPVFHRKERSEGVRTVQKMLNELGYNAGGADGIYGPKLDGAFQAFANDNGVAFAGGSIVPSELDALATRWAATLPTAAGALALKVTAEEITDDTLTFRWSLSNLGEEKCTLNAVLMGAGADHDFGQDDLVAALDGIELKANGANNASGTVTIPAELAADADAMSFCAVATGKSGAKWVSGVVNCALAD